MDVRDVRRVFAKKKRRRVSLSSPHVADEMKKKNK
jgi:hypothetical protein